MKTRWIVSALLALALAGGVLWASQGQKEKEEEELEDFVPTERVPADSSVSFPVDI